MAAKLKSKHVTDLNPEMCIMMMMMVIMLQFYVKAIKRNNLNRVQHNRNGIPDFVLFPTLKGILMAPKKQLFVANSSQLERCKPELRRERRNSRK